MGDKNSQYPGALRGKKVRIQESTGGIVIGTLREITEYHNTRLLVVELGTGQDHITNLLHMVSIEEGVN